MSNEVPIPCRGVWRQAGGTLIEVLIGVLILMVLAVAGGSYLAETRGTLAVQRNKGLALAEASGRLEAVRSSYYMQLTNALPLNYTVHYMRPYGAAWTISADPSSAAESVTISDITMPRRTLIRYYDADGGSDSFDAVLVRAEVQYRTNEWVGVETLIAP